mmetsp:Transcript_30377/g.39152  ORF Transcript_30377/g.39152 Transcript_30377/m.39152 type:complete len:290 (+) Transcript_30377:980-1849(+)
MANSDDDNNTDFRNDDDGFLTILEDLNLSTNKYEFIKKLYSLDRDSLMTLVYRFKEKDHTKKDTTALRNIIFETFQNHDFSPPTTPTPTPTSIIVTPTINLPNSLSSNTTTTVAINDCKVCPVLTQHLQVLPLIEQLKQNKFFDMAFNAQHLDMFRSTLIAFNIEILRYPKHQQVFMWMRFHFHDPHPTTLPTNMREAIDYFLSHNTTDLSTYPEFTKTALYERAVHETNSLDSMVFYAIKSVFQLNKSKSLNGNMVMSQCNDMNIGFIHQLDLFIKSQFVTKKNGVVI